MNNNIPCRRAFTDTLLELAKHDPDIVALTSDARGSVTLNQFADELPEQFVELGIAEQNAVGVAAGMASCGKKAFVCGPACFYSARSLEQVKVDVAYTQNNVKIIGVSGGVSYGALGSTHHSLHDIAVMRTFPGLTVILPCDKIQTRVLTKKLIDYQYPVYVRMGRAPVPDVYATVDFRFEIGKANILHKGNDITIIGTGETVYYALQAGKYLAQQGIAARVLDMHTIKPFDNDAVIQAARETGRIITIEEHSIFGGLGACVTEITAQYCPVPVKIMGIPDENAIHGKSPEIFEHYGLTSKSIVSVANELLKK